MHNAPRSLRRALRGASLLIATGVLVAACGGATASGPASTAVVGGETDAPSAAGPSMAPTADPRTPAPTALQLMPIGMLPQAEVPDDVQVSCEDVAGASLSCEQAVALAARIGITMTGGSPVQQVLVERDAANANVVTLTYWAIDPETPDDPAVAFTTTVDVAGGTLTFPTQNDEAVFPA
jgi:hypothetical protein